MFASRLFTGGDTARLFRGSRARLILPITYMNSNRAFSYIPIRNKCHFLPFLFIIWVLILIYAFFFIIIKLYYNGINFLPMLFY